MHFVYRREDDPLFAGYDDAFTPKQQEAVDLRNQGRTVPEIARELHISISTAKLRLRYARRKAMYVFECGRCLHEVRTESTVGECPNCHTAYKLEWQADYNSPKAKLKMITAKEGLA